MTESATTRPIPPEHVQTIRHLSHELSNALEIILQTSYLLGTVDLDENGRKWRSMLDDGVQQATRINRDLRDFVRENSTEGAEA
jgi:signal transduction histidine kinase